MTGPAEYLYDVFISYSHEDKEWVWNELLRSLEGAALRVCIDTRDFEVGVPSLINMEQAAKNSRHTLIVLTPAWVKSEWTEFESLLVGKTDPAGRRKRLVPLLLEPCEIPERISILTYADLSQPSTRVERLTHLISQINSSAANPTPSNIKFAPFVAGPPVTHPRQFFGRYAQLKRLFSLWRASPLQNAAIIGPRRSGKTSLLLYLKNINSTPVEQLRPGQHNDWLSDSERYRWVFVDFQDKRMGNHEQLLRHLISGMAIPMPSSWDVNSFIDVVSRNLRTPTIILLDEIGVALRNYNELDDSFWESMRALATTQSSGNLAFILASHEVPSQLAHHSGHSSPFFNIFGYTATLGPLTEGEARELVGGSPIPFPTSDVTWILEQSGRWPLLLQILCRERLVSLEEGETDSSWREEGLRQIAPFCGLLKTS